MTARYFLIALVLGCGGSKPATLHVCAAASLKAAFEEIDAAFKASHPEVDISLNTAGSQTLRSQIEAGAPCDVFASADDANMQALADAGLVIAPARFASNALVIAVPTANPAKIASWQDLAKVERIALAAANVPVGKYARKFLANAEKAQAGYAAAVIAHVRTNELDVAHVVLRVKLSEVDAGIVYRTDVKGDGISAIALPPELDVAADYPIAVVRRSSAPELAADFVALVLGAGQKTLAGMGFGPAR